MKHTPGPWILKQTRDGKAILINGGHVGEVHSDDIDTDEAWSNANLIAAAPEMLEALQFIVDSNGLKITAAITETVQKVINKAKGV